MKALSSGMHSRDSLPPMCASSYLLTKAPLLMTWFIHFTAWSISASALKGQVLMSTNEWEVNLWPHLYDCAVASPPLFYGWWVFPCGLPVSRSFSRCFKRHLCHVDGGRGVSEYFAAFVVAAYCIYSMFWVKKRLNMVVYKDIVVLQFGICFTIYPPLKLHHWHSCQSL